MANELAAYLTAGYGNGGGTREKAGGFLKLPDAEGDAGDFLRRRLDGYFASYDKIVVGEYAPDTSAMRRYTKKNMPQGYVRLAELYPAGAEVVVRTLEGDASFAVSPETYLMIGIQGEAYPISREKFEKTYTEEAGTFSFMPAAVTEAFYAPSVKDKVCHTPVELLSHARPCRARGESFIYARPLERNTKVFTTWYADGYMYGKRGDYLAVRGDDTNDVYIIAAAILGLSYEAAS
jgi:phosphoglycolate phosphatase